jgi:hypothetical protein
VKPSRALCLYVVVARQDHFGFRAVRLAQPEHIGIALDDDAPYLQLFPFSNDASVDGIVWRLRLTRSVVLGERGTCQSKNEGECD